MSDNSGVQYEVLSPWAVVDPIPLRSPASRLDSLDSKTIGLFKNFKRAAGPILEVVERELRERYPTVRFVWFNSNAANVLETETENREKFEEWAKEIDAAVTSVGDWGSCTKYLAYNTVAIEDYGKPVALLANYGFVTDSYSAASGKGMPGIRSISENVPCESTIEADIEKGVIEVIDQIIDALTKPLTEQEKNPPPMDTEEKSRIVFKGNLEEVNRFFYRRGWGDGMPVIPPTEEAVAEMLTGTELPPDQVVTKIIPRMGKATVEKIAINAVMAGALPTYMPVLIAACQAIMEPKTRFDTFEVSTGSWAPCYILNGPFRKDINLNCGSGTLSPGDIANATIGRAMGLIVKNIGGARKAIEDMGVLGNPSKYSLVIGENEEECPWAPLHVSRGFNSDDNTVTAFFPNSYSQTIPMQTDDKGILQAMINNARGGGMAGFLLNPPHTKYLANEGWTREKAMEYIVEHAVTNTGSGMPIGEGENAVRKVFSDTSCIIIVCVGGPGVFTGILTTAGGGAMSGFGNEFVTKKIELPKNWEKLVEKYRNVVPVYQKY